MPPLWRLCDENYQRESLACFNLRRDAAPLATRSKSGEVAEFIDVSISDEMPPLWRPRAQLGGSNIYHEFQSQTRCRPSGDIIQSAVGTLEEPSFNLRRDAAPL